MTILLINNKPTYAYWPYPPEEICSMAKRKLSGIRLIDIPSPEAIKMGISYNLVSQADIDNGTASIQVIPLTREQQLKIVLT